MASSALKKTYDGELGQIQKQLDELQLAEEELLEDMNHLLTRRTYVSGKIKALAKIMPTLSSIRRDAESLVSTIHEVSESSEGISEKIRALDRARGRVEEGRQRVSDLIDLELCSRGVQKAICDEEFEEGAILVYRFLSIDQSQLQRTAGDAEKVTGVLKAVCTLQDAADQLRAIVKNKFDDAVRSQELQDVERFFKIFPLIGMDEEGIEIFCRYLCTKIEETAQKNLSAALGTPAADPRHSVVFADALTLLFEGLARMIDTHQPVIETYYGPGRLLAAVKILQEECDRQTRRIILEFDRNRNVRKKIAQINELSRSSAAAKVERIDPKDLDVLIGEMVVMHSRTQLYVKFVRRKIANDIEVGAPEASDRAENLTALEHLLNDSQLSQGKHELLGHYLRLEQYFMEESVAKAVGLDSVDSGQYVSSMVDDAFFIIRKCIRRAISSGSLEGICVIINNACRVLESDFCGVLRSKLRQGYPSGYMDLTQAYNVLQTSIQHGRLQPGDAELNRTAFIVALNNADGSNEYIEALCDGIPEEVREAMPGMRDNERGKLESCLSGLSSVTTALKDVVGYGMQQLSASAVKPRVNPWIDAFLNVNHQFNEDELSSYEAGETFVQTLIMNLESLLSPFKDVLTPSNYDALVNVLTAEVTLRFEKVVLKSSFNRLGGLVLDKEVRSLAGYLTASTSWSLRDKFARLTQIATVLNLEKVGEISDYWGNHDGALTWRLTPTELRTIMALRSDFKVEDIRRLKL